MSRTSGSSGVDRPKICVLLATYNGARWLEQQLQSILEQSEVDLTVFVADDCSTDTTPDILRRFAWSHRNVHLLPQVPRRGSAALNFFYLIKHAPLDGFDYVAFADQDDIWFEGRLKRQVQILRAAGAQAVSSDVIAVWPDGRRKLIKKSQPMVTEDHLFEAAGPGCTYLMSRELMVSFQQALCRSDAVATGLANHDWMVYAWARSRGVRWIISSDPTMLYRQHGENELGANVGFGGARSRVRQAGSGWYRRAILEVARFCGLGETLTARQIADGGIWARVQLASRAHHFRRRRRDAWALSLMLLFGYF